jgi:hypothetical protein
VAVGVPGVPQAGHAWEESGTRFTPPMRSLLVLDCGSVFTKAALCGRVEDQFRLLARAQAPTTSAAPARDITIGLREALRGLERITGRTLLRDDRIVTPRAEDGVGVDGVALVTSVGGPLKLLVAGPGREALAGLLHRSLGGLFAQLDALPQAPPADAAHAAEWQQLVAQVHAAHPHALLILGSPFGNGRTQAGAADTPQGIAAWLDMLRQTVGYEEEAGALELPVLISATPPDATAFAEAVRARAVQAVEPLSPSTLSPINRAVGALYESAVLGPLPGYAALRAQTSAPPLAGITSLAGAARYLAQHVQTNVVAVDVGASATTLIGATPSGDFLTAAAATAGVGPGAGTVLRARGYQAIQQWLSEPVGEDEIREYVLSRMLRPHAIPTSPRELRMEHALAREAISLALHAPGSRLSGLHPLEVILGTGGVLAAAPHPGMAALILLDALQPRGISSLVLDTSAIMPMLGAAAAIDQSAAAAVADGDAVALQLGTVVSAVGMEQDGQPAVRVSLEFADGRSHIEDVAWGSIVRLPLAPGEQARLGLTPAAGVDIGVGVGQHARATDPVEGGALGLLIDARGRPLALPRDPVQRVALLSSWRRALGLEGFTA